MKSSSSKSTSSSSILRPRSAYNFFYRHQRYLIVQELSSSLGQTQQEGATPDLNDMNSIQEFLLKYCKEDRKRRKHRKTHGMINLQDLTRKIADRWKKLDPKGKKLYQSLAKQDGERYKQEVKSHNDSVSVSEHVNSSENQELAKMPCVQDEYTPRSIEDMIESPELDVLKDQKCTFRKSGMTKGILLTINDWRFILDALLQQTVSTYTTYV